MPNKTFARRLDWAMGVCDPRFSRRDLWRAGFEAQDIAAWLDEDKVPSDIKVLALADILGVSFAWLRAGEGPTHNAAAIRGRLATLDNEIADLQARRARWAARLPAESSHV